MCRIADNPHPSAGEPRVMSIEIRPLSNEDRPALRAFYPGVLREAFPWKSAAAVARDFDVDTEGEAVFVAWAGDEVVGFVSIWEPDPFVHHLYVAATHRRYGIGRRLLASALASVAGHVRLKCEKRDTGALDFYLREGWRVVGASDPDAPDEDYFLLEFDVG